jgi:hypothetical protein
MNGLLARLNRLNPTGVFLGALLLLLGLLFVPGVIGAALVLMLATALGVLLAVTWSHHPPQARALRLATLALLVVVAVAKLA